MASTFPASPSDGDVFTNTTTGVKYIFNATDGVWKTHIFPTNTNFLQLSGGTITGDLTTQRVTTVENATVGTNLTVGASSTIGSGLTVGAALSVGGGLTVGNGMTLSNGNITIAAGHGIDFSPDTNAAGMQGELLDDYERGTWTPTFATRDASNVVHALTGATYSRQSATYVKVGHLVHVRCRVTLSAMGTATVGQLNVAGLPFTVLNFSEGWSPIALGFGSGWNNFAPQGCLAVPGGNELQLYTNAGADARTSLSAANDNGHLSNTADIILAGTYRTDD